MPINLRDNYLDDVYPDQTARKLRTIRTQGQRARATVLRFRETVWDSLADMDLPSYGDVNIGADKAAYKQFGGLNNTDHPGYTFDQIATRSNKAGIGIDDMWSLESATSTQTTSSPWPANSSARPRG